MRAQFASDPHWRPVPSDETHWVSDWGLIVSVDDTQVRRLATAPTYDGYRSVVLSVAGQRTYWRVHRLVLFAFAGPPPDDDWEACHLNGDRSDNRLSNLVWGTAAENQSHRTGHGTDQVGERNPNVRLTAEDVRWMRAEYAKGVWTYKQLAELFGVSAPCVYKIVRHKTWVSA
ncbi:hypothetical protein DDP54_15695 (plasmid) [Cellulomonas sp. WB94]|uniref:HNH endonuclease signature motif containing protein n=1 Tax=Cellulomonas sp. WB94 TaxID=2173174 RepID=UPI000D57F188|nr:HNH endonuclease signature motif containing protein [Cellulomonas sp. WB94]PVU81343.1 hypothetical protein DDP54_15695 [Cellulomonas sp. WB94]